jgi:hypothetical protein
MYQAASAANNANAAGTGEAAGANATGAQPEDKKDDVVEGEVEENK